MSTMLFVVEWAVRSSILIASGALLLWLLRVKSAPVRSVAWTALLACSLALPALRAALPATTLALPRVAQGVPETPEPSVASPPAPLNAASQHESRSAVPDLLAARLPTERQGRPSEPLGGAGFAVAAYALVCGVLLLRVCIGLAISLRLLPQRLATGEATDGIEIRESEK